MEEKIPKTPEKEISKYPLFIPFQHKKVKINKWWLRSPPKPNDFYFDPI